MADNLLRPKDVAKLVQSIGVKHIKIFDYEKEIIRAFDHTGISLIVCVPNQEIIGFAQSEKAARTWVHNHIRKRVLRGAKITYIVVGNEVNSTLALCSLNSPRRQFLNALVLKFPLPCRFYPASRRYGLRWCPRCGKSTRGSCIMAWTT